MYSDFVSYVDRINVITIHYFCNLNDSIIITKLILDILLKVTNGEEKKYPFILLKALKYINSHFADYDISNDVIADHCSISVIYLQKLFAKYLKRGIKQYIDYLRQHKAEELLIATEMPIYQISSECGFTNQITFFRAFEKTHDGLTPAKYRKLNIMN